MEGGCLRRPLDLHRSQPESTGEAMHSVGHVHWVVDGLPAHLEGDAGWIARPVEQRVVEVVVVLLVQVVRSQGSSAVLETETHRVAGDWLGPEEATFANAGIEIVDLVGANGPIEQIHSYEAESPVVAQTVLANVETIHEPVVHLVVEAGGCPSTPDN